MLTPLADRDTKNDLAANLTRIKGGVTQAVTSLQAYKTELLGYVATMTANPTLYTADERAEVNAIIASAAAQIQAILS